MVMAEPAHGLPIIGGKLCRRASRSSLPCWLQSDLYGRGEIVQIHVVRGQRAPLRADGGEHLALLVAGEHADQLCELARIDLGWLLATSLVIPATSARDGRS